MDNGNPKISLIKEKSYVIFQNLSGMSLENFFKLTNIIFNHEIK